MSKKDLYAATAMHMDVSFSCTALKRHDGMKNMDPFAVLYFGRLGNPSRVLSVVGRTETLRDTSHPAFRKVFVLDYVPEENQRVRVEVYDEEEPADRENMSSQYLIGSTRDFQLSEAVATMGGKGLRLELVKDDVVFGFITFKSERNKDEDFLVQLLEMSADEIEAVLEETPKTLDIKSKMIGFKCRGIGLDRKDLFGKSDPYFTIERKVGNKLFLVFKSETVPKNLDPSWNSFSISLSRLCGNDANESIYFKVYDWDKVLVDELIGEFTCTLNDIILKNDKNHQLIEPSLAKKKGYTNSGIFQFEHFTEFEGVEVVTNPEYHTVEKALIKKRSGV